MSYLDRLKACIGHKHPQRELTELTKTPSVSSVSEGSRHFQGWEAKLDELAERTGVLISNNVPWVRAFGLTLLILTLAINSALTSAKSDQAEDSLC